MTSPLVALYRELARPVLFAEDAENAHQSVLRALAAWQRVPVAAALIQTLTAIDAPRLATTAFGCHFALPIGLAAGLDKDAEAMATWAWLGFGHAEAGTMTPRPQPGNPRPRLFRLPAATALINRMGFNSAGTRRVAENLAATPAVTMPIGANIGKNKETPNAAAVDDYLLAISDLRGRCAWFTLNVSSPNTPDLRQLQEPARLRDLVAQSVRAAAPTPVLVKLAPDFGAGELEATVDAVLEGGAAGIIASNTTLQRPGLGGGLYAGEAGGLSGAPLRALATQAIRRVRSRTAGRVPIIGVGGIATADDAWEKLLAGADLLQIYTALIYDGPGLVRTLHGDLLQRLEREGARSLSEVVGQG